MRWAGIGGAAGRAASIALLIALGPQLGCGVAQRVGKGAAQGALGALASKPGTPQEVARLAKGATKGVAGGLVTKLSRPEQLEDVQRIAGAMGAGIVHGASSAALASPGLGDRPAEAIASQAARAFSREIRAELGPTGEGPLAMSLENVAERVSRASSVGVAAGIRESLGVWPMVIAFGAGAFITLAIAWAWAVYRARRLTRA